MAGGLASHGNCLKNEKDIRHNYKYKTDVKKDVKAGLSLRFQVAG